MTSAEKLWLAIGFLAQGMFFGRFLIQWLASEKAKRSVIPPMFWYLSISGAIGTLCYAIYRRDPVFIAGQGIGLLVYFRNLWFIRSSKKVAAVDSLVCAPIGKGEKATPVPCYALVLPFLFLMLAGWELRNPLWRCYDELYQIPLARSLLIGQGYRDATHPPLGKMLIALSIAVFGDSAWTWRIPSLLTGSASVFLVYLLAKNLFKNLRTAFFCSLFFAMDGLSIFQARLAMLNAPALFFSLLSLVLISHLIADPAASRRVFFRISGFCWGLAMATKLITIFFGIPVFALLTLVYVQAKNKKDFWKEAVVGFLVMPAIAYASVYIVLALLTGKTWRQLIDENINNLVTYHLKAIGYNAFSSRWWSWPLLLTPQYVHVQALKNGLIRVIWVMGNPAICWVIPVAFLYTALLCIRRRLAAAGILLLGFFAQWLPYLFVKRIQFIHYFYFAMPFVVMMFGLTLEFLWEKKGVWKGIAASYLAVVIFTFAFWYPLNNAIPVSPKFIQMHIWLSRWQKPYNFAESLFAQAQYFY